jgi:CheY-like chemotaxis protein
MDGELKLINTLDKSIGEKAFVLNVASKALNEDTDLLQQSVGLDEISLNQIDVTRGKILIFED